MKIVAIAVLVVAWAGGAGGARAEEITIDDVIAMAQAGVSEEILFDAVDGKSFALGDAEVARLREAGVTDRVIDAMRGDGPDAVAAHRARVQAEEAKRRDELARERERLRAKGDELRADAALAARGVDERLDRELDRAYDLVESRRYAEAAVSFDRLVAGGALAPNTARRVDANYGLALTLTRLGLPSAAAPVLVDVLRHGPEAPRYAEALRLLARWADTVDYTHPILEVIDSHELVGVDRDLADEHAYLVGGYRARFGDWDRARARLASVRADGARGAAAAYRLGLVEVAAGRPLEGLRAFERAVERAERHGHHGVRDLAYLSLARIAYEVGRWDAAADYYRRIPPDSHERADARRELVWTLLLAGDDLGALAALAAVDSPRYRDLVALDLGAIEATIYLDLCRYDDAVARADALLAEIAPLAETVDAVLELSPTEAWERARSHAVLRRVLAADVDTHVAASAAEAVERERGTLGARADELGELAGRVERALVERRRLLRDQAASAALRRLRAFRLELTELAVNADEVKVEVQLAMRELLRRPLVREEVRAATKTPPVRDDEMRWEVDDERWIDEEDSYRALRPSQCGDAP